MSLDFFNDDDKPSSQPAKAVAAPANPEAMPSEPAAVSGARKQSMTRAAIVVGGLVVLGLAFMGIKTMMGGHADQAAPTVAQAAPLVPSAVAPGVQPGTPDPNAQPGQPGAQPAATTINVAVDSEDVKANIALSQKFDAMRNMWPANQRDCQYLPTVPEMNICKQVTAAKYFKCAPNGRNWNPTIPGCEV